MRCFKDEKGTLFLALEGVTSAELQYISQHLAEAMAANGITDDSGALTTRNYYLGLVLNSLLPDDDQYEMLIKGN